MPDVHKVLGSAFRRSLRINTEALIKMDIFQYRDAMSDLRNVQVQVSVMKNFIISPVCAFLCFQNFAWKDSSIGRGRQ